MAQRSKNPDEATCGSGPLASGMVPYCHFVGAEEGFGEDRRWQKTSSEYFRVDCETRRASRQPAFHRQHGCRLRPKHATALPRPGHGRTRDYMRDTTNGLYDALLRGRFAFDFVHEDRLDPERCANIARCCCPISPCSAIASASRSATTSVGRVDHGQLRDRTLRRESKATREFGLADLLGISKAGNVIGTVGNAYYGRIERQHPILDGFSNTNWIPGAQNRIPLKPVQDPVLTVVPGFVRYPPELAYPPVSHTTEPAVVLRESGSSRTGLFPRRH